MKILDEKERDEHFNTVLKEGAKGCLIGAGVAAALVYSVKRRYPAAYANYNASIKAAMWAMPTISLGAFFADDGSWKFDEQMHRSEYIEKVEKEKQERWEKLSTADKIFTSVNDNKYYYVAGGWVFSIWGSWHYINKDKYLSVTQKAVQARVYAQAVTVLLLLGTLLMLMHDQTLKKDMPAPVPEWKKYLEEHKNDSAAKPREHHKHEAQHTKQEALHAKETQNTQ